MTIIKYQALDFTGGSLGVFKTREEAEKAAGFNGSVRQDITNVYSQPRSVEWSWS